jgi:hypothetical protein
VWAEFRSNGPNRPTRVTVDGTSYSLPHDQLLFRDATYQFTNPPPPPGSRYLYSGECSGTVTFPGTVDAAAARSLACGAVLQNVTYADVIRGDGPVAYWRLGDSVPTAQDSGPFGLDGSYEPGVTEGVPGAIVNDPNTAAEFAGGGVAVPSYVGLDILGPLSVEVWAKGGPQQPYGYLISKSDWSGTIGYSLYAGANGTLRFFVGTGSAQITDETGFTWDGQWHHIVGAYDGSTVSLYVDKALVASTPASGTIQSSFGTPLTLGRFNGGGFTFAGDLDEVAIYDHALTADQIHHHYNQASFGSING